MFFESLNGALEAMFKELSNEKRLAEKKRKNLLQEIQHTPFLFSSEELNIIMDGGTEEDYETILDHMYRHDATEVHTYKAIENEIIKRMW